MCGGRISALGLTRHIVKKGYPMLNAMGCPECALQFTPKRSNQHYCSTPCQKKATRNSNRSDRSNENRQRTKRHYERSWRLTEMLYSVPPTERLGEMKRILSYVPVDSGLRNILTDPALLKERPCANGTMNIAKAADAYVRMFFGVSISTYVRKARDGLELEGVEVKWDSGRSSVPRLRPSLTDSNVRCWHKPLTHSPMDLVSDMRVAADATRLVDPELGDQTDLKADVKQARLVTEADYGRMAAILAESHV